MTEAVADSLIPTLDHRDGQVGVDVHRRYRRSAMPLAATAESPVARRLGTLALGLALVGVGVALTCVAIGWAMGGQVGVGTVAFALLIGPTLKRMLAASGFDPARASEASDCAAPGA